MKIVIFREEDDGGERFEFTPCRDEYDWHVEVRGMPASVNMVTPHVTYTISCDEEGTITVHTDDGEPIVTRASFKSLVAAAKKRVQALGARLHPTRQQVEEALHRQEWKENPAYPGTWYHPRDAGQWIIFADDCQVGDLAKAKSQGGAMTIDDFWRMCARK